MYFIGLVAVLGTQLTDPVQKPPLPGFVIGHQQATTGASIVEEIPDGETVHQWTRMVTTQRFANLAARTTPEDFLARLAEGAAGSCVGAIASEVKRIEGAAQVRLDCPTNPQTGLPETFIAKAMASGSDLHIVQVAWRRVPTAKDEAWATAYLEAVTVKP